MQALSIITICVNYHNDKETARFVKDLLAQEGVFTQMVIVIDNSESPRVSNCLHILSKTNEQIWLRHPGKNLGYYGGAAWGLREFIKEFPLPDWIIVCNTDIKFLQSNFISNLCAFHSEGSYAVVAPAIISKFSGRDTNPHLRMRPSRIRMHFLKCVFRYYPISMAYNILSLAKDKIRFMLKLGAVQSYANSKQKGPIPQQIYAPQGSFVAFNRKYFESGGTLDHGAFLFGEEIFVAETARRLGLTIAYDPRLKIEHREHRTTGLFKSRRLFGFVRDAAEYSAMSYFKK